MGLAETDIRLVQESWEPVAENLENNGVFIVKTFLDKHDYYSNFPRFRDHPRDTIADNPAFRSHSLKVINVIDEAIRNLDQPEQLDTVLQQLGEYHAKKKIELIHFKNLQIVILDILRGTFGISKEQETAWNNALDALVKGITKGLQK